MLRIFSLFSGIGAFEKALERLGIDHEVIAYCEINSYASKAYSIIHGIPESKNLRDVTKVDILDIDETVDLVTYGFPCQDISIAGKQKGFTDEDGKRTRSGLFFEALRIIDDYRPKFAIAKNVKALTGAKFSQEFKIVLESLKEIGYNNYYAVLDSKYFRTPQTRPRVIIISIRKDIDRGFTFPHGEPVNMSIDDILDTNIDESYYLADYIVNRMIPKTSQGDVRLVGQIYPKSEHSSGRVVSPKGIAYTLKTCEGGNTEPKIFTEDGRIRKLTPRECFRLMTFDVEDYDKIVSLGYKRSQFYKLAGNSIVVNVLEAIFTELGKTYDEFKISESRGGSCMKISPYERRRQELLKANNPCYAACCAWNDPDCGCTCSSDEMWYQCPLEPEPDWDAIMSESEVSK